MCDVLMICISCGTSLALGPLFVCMLWAVFDAVVKIFLSVSCCVIFPVIRITLFVL